MLPLLLLLIEGVLVDVVLGVDLQLWWVRAVSLGMSPLGCLRRIVCSTLRFATVLGVQVHFLVPGLDTVLVGLRLLLLLLAGEPRVDQRLFLLAIGACCTVCVCGSLGR